MLTKTLLPLVLVLSACGAGENPFAKRYAPTGATKIEPL